MIIKGKVYCLFEQSGTFKDEFIKLGIDAFDCDIQNEFNVTDKVVDLFKEIDNAYLNNDSIFDEFTSDDLLIAFYPCIYFCATSQIAFNLNCINYQHLSFEEKIEQILKRSEKREEYYTRLIRLCAVCQKRNLRLIVENPWSEQTYLKANFIKAPDLVDTNRRLRGDYFAKPTAYWYWNCEPTSGSSFQQAKKEKTVLSLKGNSTGGMCSAKRSMISSDYARNFICDFIIGKEQKTQQHSIFDFEEEEE